MYGFVSAVSRAIWAFIALSAAVVLAVAATDHPLAWKFLSAPGFIGIAVFSLFLGWALRSRIEPVSDAEEEAPAAASTRREPAINAELTPRVEADAATPALVATRRYPTNGAEGAEAVNRRSEPVLTRNAMEGVDGTAAAEDRSRPGHMNGRAVRVPPASGNSKIDACFAVADLKDAAETRDWTQIPALVEANGLRDAEDRAAALSRMSDIVGEHEDYEPLYLWIAGLLDSCDRPNARDSVLREGLRAARSKSAILAALGLFAIEDRRMGDAVKWLIRSVALQLGGGQSETPDAFVNLAALGQPYAPLFEACAWLKSEAERRDAKGDARLDDERRERLAALSRAQGDDWMIGAIEALHEFYGKSAPVKGRPLLLLTPRNSPSRAGHRRRPQALQ